MNTTVFRNPTWASMKAMAAALIDKLKWRHHGIGVLQGYVVEGSEPEVRLHIWSKRLLKPGMDVSGDIHDHRFDMVSHVLYGFVEHEEILEREDPEGSHAMLSLTHARAAADTQYHGPTTALAGRYRVSRLRHVIDAGFSYTFKAQVFHRSPLGEVSDLAVTCVEKHRQVDTPARLLYPVAHEPVMAFGHTPNADEIRELVAEAKRRLAL